MSKVAKSVPEALKLLWQEKFFTKNHTAKEIESGLEKRGYNFADKALLMALKNAKFLTRRGKVGEYTYIQKHPFVDED